MRAAALIHTPVAQEPSDIPAVQMWLGVEQQGAKLGFVP